MVTRIQGRPRATTHAAIEDAAFVLFEERGFEATTLGDIATAVGIGRRTLFRYYPSKNDILWGQFDASLDAFRAAFSRASDRTPLPRVIEEAVREFNTFPVEAMAQHRKRMHLLLQTPALLAHSELRYSAWREVIADYVAGRLGVDPTSSVPVMVGRVSLALSLSAYDQWLRRPGLDLQDAFREAFVDHAATYGS